MSNLIEQFGLNNHYSSFHNIHFINKYNWDYKNCVEFQEAAMNTIIDDESKVYIIQTSHPLCLTLGRGRESQNFTLPTHLDIDLHHIHRGGGVTFHHEKQWICYPIFKLNKFNMDLKSYIYSLLDSISEFINTSYYLNTKKVENPLGLWSQDHKIASMGVGLKKYITQHGVALNVKKNKDLDFIFKAINPCGLNSSVYSSIEKECGEEVNYQDFCEKIDHHIKNDWCKKLYL